MNLVWIDGFVVVVAVVVLLCFGFLQAHAGIVISHLTRTDLDPRLKEGTPLVQVNEDKVTEESAAELFQFLSAWNELEIGVDQPVTLAFDPNAQLDVHQLERAVAPTEHVLREEVADDLHDSSLDDSNIVLRLLSERIQIPVGPTVMVRAPTGQSPQNRLPLIYFCNGYHQRRLLADSILLDVRLGRGDGGGLD